MSDEITPKRKGKIRVVNTRMPLNKATLKQFSKFKDGLSTTYDDALQFVLEVLAGGGDPYEAGKRLRDKFDVWNAGAGDDEGGDDKE